MDLCSFRSSFLFNVEYQDQIQKKSSNPRQAVVSLGTQIMIDQEEEDKSATQVCMFTIFVFVFESQ